MQGGFEIIVNGVSRTSRDRGEVAQAAANFSCDARLRGPFDAGVDLIPKRIEVDGLCQQRFGTIFQCLPLVSASP